MNGLTKEEELGLKDKQRVIDSSAMNDEYKENYLNSYFEDLNLSIQEPDWSQMIIHAMEFHDFYDCKSLLDMMEDGEFVCKYKHELETKFEEMLTWFIKVRLGITTRPILPYASHNRKVDLLGLYMVVKRDGGYRNVTDNNRWAVVAKDMGYEYHNDEFMRIIYAMHLDVLVYHYKFKTVQGRVIDKEVIKESEGSSDARHERRKSAGDLQDKEAMQHCALFAGNGWEGAMKMQKKCRKFNFK
ncbi:putative transcription factor & chromatin remodeling ARID family [Helianthus annuus]|uniref:Transcription factor & chromatin remodeling ARID family n=1 Tax=Helianthus annuus TaxID=4232 RepID=A0A9K3DUU2_HELAN|nr:putative transcription factor & chromatin remodeling ARID family [Helianthus annuus]KAJ0444113.1 putative transcription factor & chromatin remodeling ARID family [Helianthus annuus]KAJ0641898.1 putative transcription factor & chromatin remodeling ARID family [Helianthus annuus]